MSLLFNLRDFLNIKHHTLNVWSQGKQLVLLSESSNVSRDEVTFEFDQGHMTKNQSITMLVFLSESLGISRK